MKKLTTLFLFVTLFTQVIHAQIIDSIWGSTRYDSTDYQFEYKWERLFENVSTQKVTTGFFMNKAVNFINPLRHTGNLSNNDNEAHVETMGSLHTALKMAQITHSPVLKDSTPVLWDTARQYLTQGIVPIGAMFMGYSRFRDDIFEEDLITFNAADTTLHMGSDTSQSAFIETNFFIAAPYSNELVQGIHSFAFPLGLYLSNLPEVVDYATLKFDNMDGEYTLLPDGMVSIDFTSVTVGETGLTIKLCFTNGKCLYAKTRFRFLQKAGPPTVYSNRMNTINFTPTANDAGGTLEIALGCGKTELTKPLIIVEAFDPTNTQNFDEIYKQLTKNTEVEHILREFETQGYDLVYLNYANGGDDITRNAEFFRRALIHINNLKHANGSTEPNAVLGISMGALVAKIGLRTMELVSQDHETDLYMSLDGPHKGAYMPHSLLQMLAHFENLSKRKVTIPTGLFSTEDVYWFPMPQAAKDAIALLSCPAAKQMIVANVLDNGFTHNASGVLTGITNNTFYTVYNALGSLAHCREVALTNGSIAQKNQQYDADLSYGFMPDNLLLGEFGGNASTLYPLMQNTSFNFKMLGLPNKLANTLYYKGRIDMEVYIGAPWTLSFNLTNYDLSTKAANTLAYDNAPGGYLDVKEFGDIESAAKGFGSNANFPFSRFCFVPATSSLAIGTDNLRYDILAHSSVATIPLNNTTYSYYTPTYSTPLFKQYSAPPPGAAVSNYWNEGHGQPSPQSAVALGYELLAPAKGLPLIIDNAIYVRDSIIDTIQALYPWIPLDSLLTHIPFPYLALNYGYKRMIDNNDLIANSGNVIHRSLTFPAYVKLNINSEQPVVSPTFNNPPVFIDTTIYIMGQEIILDSFPISLGRTFTPDANSSFTLSTAGAGCGTAPITVTIKENSEMRLGSSTGNRTGILNINNGATVTFENGSTLKLYNRSKIIVRNGSTLEIDVNVPIHLYDTGCYIELEPGSTLRLLNGRVLNRLGNGYIKIRGGEIGQNVNIIGKVNLIGTGKTDKVLELEGFNTILGPTATKRIITIPNTMTELHITDGRVKSNCELTTDAETIIDNSYFDNGIYYFNNTLESNISDWLANLNCFEDTKVIGGTVGGELYAANIIDPGKQLEVNGVVFNGLETEGLKVYNCNTDIHNSSFLDNNYPMQFEGMSSATELREININNDAEFGVQARGIKYYGGTGSSLHLLRCNILNQDLSGIIVENAPLSMLCSKVVPSNESVNANSVYLKESASLILDPSLITNGAGNSDLSGYHTTVYATDAEDIQINDGRSNLASIEGDVFSGTINTDYSPGIKDFYANENYWKGGAPPSRINNYYYFFYKTPNPYVPNAFETKQFDVGANGYINAGAYLTSPPNLANLCPLEGEGGGEGMDKTSRYQMRNPVIVSGEAVQYNSLFTLKDMASQVYHPSFEKRPGNEKLNQCATIIYNNYQSKEANAKPIIKMVYQKMLSAMGEEIKKGTIPFNKASAESETVLQTQNHLLTHYNPNAEEKYALLTDKALTLRIQGKYSEALSVLSDIKTNSYYMQKHAAFISRWECQLKNEQLFYSGNITNKQFKQLAGACKEYDRIGVVKSERVESRIIPEETRNMFATDEVKSYPNPASDIITVEWTSDVRVYSVRMMTVEGKMVFEKNIPNNADATYSILPTGGLNSGMYFLEFVSNKKVTPLKVLLHK